MNKHLKKALMPLFRVLAKPGIVNPHTPYETELMLAGVKPVAIMYEDDITEDLLNSMKSGTIIEIGKYIFEKKCRLFYHPSQQNNAEKAIKIFQSNPEIRKPLSTLDKTFLDSFLEFPLQEKSLTLARKFQKKCQNRRPPSFTDLINGRITSIHPTRCTEYDDTSELEKAEELGLIKSYPLTLTSPIIVLAQKNKIEEGKELYARYYCKSEGYIELEDFKDWNARIGELLGYTKNDIELSNAKKFTKIMAATRNIRVFARKTYMLNENKPIYYAPQMNDF